MSPSAAFDVQRKRHAQLAEDVILAELDQDWRIANGDIDIKYGNRAEAVGNAELGRIFAVVLAGKKIEAWQAEIDGTLNFLEVLGQREVVGTVVVDIDLERRDLALPDLALM